MYLFVFKHSLKHSEQNHEITNAKKILFKEHNAIKPFFKYDI